MKISNATNRPVFFVASPSADLLTLSNHQKSIENIDRIIEILRVNGLAIPDCIANKLKYSPEVDANHKFRFVSDSNCYNINKLRNGDYKFTDRKDGTVYTISMHKTDIIIEILKSQSITKSYDFKIPEKTEFHNMIISRLSTDEYAGGLPFLLSCETGHCDFIGGVGANYPLAEYLSGEGVSCKVETRYHDSYSYSGHFNLWKTADKNIVIGTIAIKREEVKSIVFRQLIEKFSVALLNENPDVSNVLLGMGGQNLNTLFPNTFNSPSSSNFKALGECRYAENIHDEYISDHLKTITDITKLEAYGKVELNDQERIGMLPDQRPDMKNALVFMDRSAMREVEKKERELLKKIIRDYQPIEEKLSRSSFWKKKTKKVTNGD
ncbi:hypothetical protein [Pantoea sp. SORGH_AS_0659]|uniref:hypothetical protein n=1 Tax=Pantoea sp. SORGH_AS_0659 TaxID=3062597 RepID=UPI00285D13E8|nr:hypothetical protein [Pantoea sp. SORGH_AS_0659]MDR6352581.1 hypothetical protein [Pantoea sp. SORGH_AS_0659]